MTKLQQYYPKAIFFLYVFGWFLLSFSVSFSKATTSIGQIILASTWILAWDWKNKWYKIKSAPAIFWLTLAIYALFILGMFNSEDLKYGFKDLKNKLPLLAIPVVYFTGLTLPNKYQKVILILFIVGGIVSSFCGVVMHYNEINTHGFDTRELSPFISHIQLNQGLSISVLIIYHFLVNQKSKLKYLLLIPLIWILYYLSISQSLTALISFAIVGTVIVFYNFYLISKKISIAVLVIGLAFGTYFTFEVYKIYQINFKLDEVSLPLKEETNLGNKYNHNLDDKRTENGNYIGLYIQEYELKKAWEQRSEIAYDSKINTYPISETIIRFLTSKNLPKDTEGINSLTIEEIKAIEAGIGNVYYLNHKGIRNRIHRTFWELNKWSTTNYYEASSLVMRFYYWKVGYQIFKKNPWFGVGTGDVKIAFKEQYKLNQSLLPEKYQRRAHNQYLTTFLTLGIFGGTAFFVICFWIGIIGIKTKSALGIGTTLILLFGLLYEDATETQAGITLLVFGLIWIIGYFKPHNPIIKHQS